MSISIRSHDDRTRSNHAPTSFPTAKHRAVAANHFLVPRLCLDTHWLGRLCLPSGQVSDQIELRQAEPPLPHRLFCPTPCFRRFRVRGDSRNPFRPSINSLLSPL